MISRRTFLKRLGMAGMIAMADPISLAEMVKPDAPVEDVLGPIIHRIKTSTHFPLKYIGIPSRDYEILESQISPGAKFIDRVLCDKGVEHLLIKGVPIVRKPEMMGKIKRF